MLVLVLLEVVVREVHDVLVVAELGAPALLDLLLLRLEAALLHERHAALLRLLLLHVHGLLDAVHKVLLQAVVDAQRRHIGFELYGFDVLVDDD